MALAISLIVVGFIIGSVFNEILSRVDNQDGSYDIRRPGTWHKPSEDDDQYDDVTTNPKSEL